MIQVINLTSKYSVQSCCHLVWGQYLLYTFRIEIGIEIDLFLPKDRSSNKNSIFFTTLFFIHVYVKGGPIELNSGN